MRRLIVWFPKIHTLYFREYWHLISFTPHIWRLENVVPPLLKPRVTKESSLYDTIKGTRLEVAYCASVAQPLVFELSDIDYHEALLSYKIQGSI